jgi:molybdopterin-binding protein
MICSLFLLSLAACGTTGSGTNVSVTDTGNIEGTVKDVLTGEVVTDVTVQIGTQAAITGTNGVYSVANLSVGSRTISASKSGYQIYNGTVIIEKGKTINQNIQLSPSGSAGKTTATVTISLTGTLPDASAIVGTDFTLTLPANVTPLLNNGVIASGVVTMSGTFAGGAMTPPVYTSVTATSAGTLKITLVNAVPSGVTQTGEVATITLQLANGTVPTSGSFTVTGVSVIDKKGNAVAGMNAVVSGVTL